MLLLNKTAVIYGATGAVGAAVAKTFAREGAKVFLTGRNEAAVSLLAEEINAAGGKAKSAQVDALNEKEIEQHLQRVIEETGSLDISFNAVGLRNTKLQGVPLVDLAVENFMAPILSHVQSNFLTARHAGRYMTKKAAGIILMVTSIPSRVAIPLMGGVAVAMAAEEALIRNLSAEFGPYGVRVVGLRPQGMFDSDTIKEVHSLHAAAYGITRDEFRNTIEARTHLKRSPSLQEMAEVAAFMACDRASAMAGTIVNMSFGAIAD